MIDVRWYGRGGQGVFTAARLLGRIISVYQGGYALSYPSFGPERRGAPVWGFTRIDDEKIIDRGQPESCDYLIIFDETLVDEGIFDVLKEDGVAIMNTSGQGEYGFVRQKLVCMDAGSMAMDILGRPITNVAMIGALSAVSGIFGPDVVDKAIKEQFPFEIYEKNKRLLDRSYECAKGGNHLG
ncbi:MAG: 2-oxoacid:acceptor oxidoreductase family protein [Clostridiales Family XIII bacterium]|jgi:pyruvate ferredoxin oxidoreductase gamma subunit|nr:2-oxoacid:acceptor oxidoreductase family protein [Clostridiales Family XIII bacterium]